jgi:hypothetical protein
METSKLGKSVYLKMSVWWDEEQGDIHLTASGDHGFHTTVNDSPTSKRRHPNLFRNLAKALREGGAPHPLIEEVKEA